MARRKKKGGDDFKVTKTRVVAPRSSGQRSPIQVVDHKRKDESGKRKHNTRRDQVEFEVAEVARFRLDERIKLRGVVFRVDEVSAGFGRISLTVADFKRKLPPRTEEKKPARTVEVKAGGKKKKKKGKKKRRPRDE